MFVCAGSLCVCAGHKAVIDVNASLWTITAGDLERDFLSGLFFIWSERGVNQKMYTVIECD